MTPTIKILFMCVALVGCGSCTRTVVKTDENARSHIESSGVKLPASATDLYYAYQPQFADYLDTWISFTATAADCKSVAESLAGSKTSRPTFVSGTRSQSVAVTGGPAYHHPEFATTRWDLSTVTNGTVFETKGLFVLIDNDKSRIYISMRTR